jgi:hypothetical protein
MLLQRLFGFAVVVSLAISTAVWGQAFTSGSTGADGALDLTSSQTIQVPASGIFNYTTVTIAEGATLSFVNNLANTPVTMLAQAAVNIAGTINISAPVNSNGYGGSTPGPGGFYGGETGTPGWGPGGGAPLANGQWIGPLSLFPNIGGSGGGGASQGCPYYGATYSGPGGGGGGAITIASSTSITIANSGVISANGTTTPIGPCNGAGPFGANGAVRLVANSIAVAGSVSAAVFRMEAPTGSNSYTGSGTAPVIATINPDVVPTKPPSLQIVSVGGYKVPANSGSSFTTIDLLLPNQLQDPIAVVVEAKNVPVGSPVTINFNNSPSATFPPVNLTGTRESSTATLSVTGLNRGAVDYLFVYTIFNASQIAQNLNPLDPASVSKIEVASSLGGRTHYRFLQREGTEVSPSKLPLALKSAFGL